MTYAYLEDGVGAGVGFGLGATVGLLEGIFVGEPARMMTEIT